MFTVPSLAIAIGNMFLSTTSHGRGRDGGRRSNSGGRCGCSLLQLQASAAAFVRWRRWFGGAEKDSRKQWRLSESKERENCGQHNQTYVFFCADTQESMSKLRTKPRDSRLISMAVQLTLADKASSEGTCLGRRSWKCTLTEV